MTMAVRNWKQDVEGTSVYQDLVEESRVHYGPQATWSELSLRSLGNRATIVQGEVDLGYSAEELANLMARLQGKRLSPLVAKTMKNTLRLAVDVDPVHTINLTVLPSIPFPKAQLNASIMHSASEFEQLLEEIRQGWLRKTLLSGELSLEYEMVDANAAYTVSLNYRDAARHLAGDLGNKIVASKDIYRAATKYIEGGFAGLAKTMFPDGSRPLESEVKSYLVDRLVADMFTPDETMMTFDGGETLSGQRLRESGSLHESVQFLLIRSSRVAETIRVFSS